MKTALALLFAVPLCAQILIVTPHADDYLLSAGGTVAAMIQNGAKGFVVRVTNDEKDAFGITPEEGALRSRAESEEAARVLGVSEAVSLGYRSGELAGVSQTELRDRIGVRELGTRFLRHAHAELLGHARARLGLHVHRQDLVGARSARDEAADDGARHVAAADEGDAH